MPDYEFVEGAGTETILLIKEDNVLSDQTFEVEVLVAAANTSEYGEADIGVDLNASIGVYPFPPELQEISIEVTLLEDSETEGPEAFRLSLGIPLIAQPGAYPCATIVIRDISGMFC